MNSSPTNFASTCFYSDFHVIGVVVHLGEKNILKSPLNAPNNSTVKSTIVVVVLILSLHPSSLLLLPLPITSAGTIIGSPPPLCTVVSLICMLIYAIPFYLSTNNMSWIDYYYKDNVNTMDALIVSVQMVLVGFVLHMVGSVYVAMILAQTLLKLEDGASNMVTRSLLAAWMDAVIRALRMDFAKDMDATVVAMSSIVQITYSARIHADFIIL
jgi:hypothetical protein